MMQLDEHRGSAPASRHRGGYRHAGFYAELKEAPRPAPRAAEKIRPVLPTWSASTAEGLSPIAVIFNGLGLDNAPMKKRELKRNNLRPSRSLSQDFTATRRETALRQSKIPVAMAPAPTRNDLRKRPELWPALAA